MWPFTSRKSRRLNPTRPSFRLRVGALEERMLLSAGALDTTFNPGGSPPGTASVAINSTDPKAVYTKAAC